MILFAQLVSQNHWPGHTPVGAVWLNRGLLLSTQHPYMIGEELGPFQILADGKFSPSFVIRDE